MPCLRLHAPTEKVKACTELHPSIHPPHPHTPRCRQIEEQSKEASVTLIIFSVTAASRALMTSMVQADVNVWAMHASVQLGVGDTQRENRIDV